MGDFHWNTTFVNGASDIIFVWGQWPLCEEGVRACLAGLWCHHEGVLLHPVSSLLLHAEVRVDLHVKCPLLLSEFKQILNVLTDLSKTPQYQMLLKSADWFVSCYRQTWQSYRLTFATSLWTHLNMDLEAKDFLYFLRNDCHYCVFPSKTLMHCKRVKSGLLNEVLEL
jgi:hypothetical protein